MCGACGGDRGAGDWARPLLSSLPARTAVASVVSGLAGRGVRVTATSGGWLVGMATGASVDCAGLGELVAATGRWLGPVEPGVGVPEVPGFVAGTLVAGGPLACPVPDARRGVCLRVDAASTPVALSDEADTVVVGDAGAALDVLAELSRPPWSLRRRLSGLSGLSGLDRDWAGRPGLIRVSSAEYGADLLVWLEHNRRLGRWDDVAMVASCPLGEPHRDVRIELRAGHVVAMTVSSRTA